MCAISEEKRSTCAINRKNIDECRNASLVMRGVFFSVRPDDQAVDEAVDPSSRRCIPSVPL